MAQPRQGTCAPWATIADVCAPCDAYDFDPALLEDCLQMASDVLFALTGYVYPGVCTETVRPCAQYDPGDPGPPSRRATLPSVSTGSPGSMSGWRPGTGSSMWGFCSCNREIACGCFRLPSISLGGVPIVEVTSVLIDGIELDPSEYRVDDYSRLVRLPAADGTNEGWPCCQDLTVADDEVGAFAVTRSVGVDPPVGGRLAAASLGCQLALAFTPRQDAPCRLPRRVTSITRQGVSIAVLDPLSLFRDGLTGLAEVDLWVQSDLIGRRRSPAMFGNPEQLMRPKVRRTNT